MTSGFEELDYQDTPLGELSLRRRRSPSIPGEPVYEVKLGNQMLMSSSVNASEQALARLALDRMGGRTGDVLVGGLGLGYTAAAALEFPNVRRLVVVEFLAPVIEWHRKGLVPMSGLLTKDPRCSLVNADFFQYVAEDRSEERRELFDVILLDIDHSPESWLHPDHGRFYGDSGLRELARNLAPDGVFGLWSAAPPTDQFLSLVGRLFPAVRSHEISFFNPHLSAQDSNWVVIAATASEERG